MDTLLDRFCRYVRIDTQADEKAMTYPSSPGQLELGKLLGSTIITTDGTTLLGSDDKSGVAVIMETAAYLAAHAEIRHGPIRICFTCDEEVGHGVDHLDLKKLAAHVAYTLDGVGQ